MFAIQGLEVGCTAFDSAEHRKILVGVIAS